MRKQKIQFPNAEGQSLAAWLELPNIPRPRAYVLFAHCFTCNKNLNAVRNISKGLNDRGFAVLRFDFTGLGESEGTFQQTNFSSNVSDLIMASEYLAHNYEAPSLLIGHSLGGAAVLYAAGQLANCKGVVTIGAPSEPKHVERLFSGSSQEIDIKGQAEVSIGGRPFTVTKQFIDDLNRTDLSEQMQHLRKPLLVMHSPQDNIVSIKNAAAIYKNAWHPKSFISLDGADHLLSDSKDSLYVADVIGSWAGRYIPAQEIEESIDHGVVAVIDNVKGYTTAVRTAGHQLTADEPKNVGGNDLGPNPYELVSAGLAACTAITVKMYAARKEWDLQELKVFVNHKKNHLNDCEHCDESDAKIDHFNKQLEIEGDLDEKQRQRLLVIAAKCPVHRTLSVSSEIHSQLSE